jgi:predicted acylesterase/phospholipase RssA/CRP-like cAMP-binding protein
MRSALPEKEKLEQLRTALRPLFGELERGALEALAERVEWMELAGQARLLRQGEVGDSLYVLLSGRLQVVLEADNGDARVVGEISRGESVGEMALLKGERRNASIYAIRDSLLVRIPRSAFESIADAHPQLLWNLSRLVIRRLEARSRVASRRPAAVSNLAVVPTSRSVATRAFVERLVTALSSHGDTLHLNPRSLGRQLKRNGIAQAPEEGPEHLRLTAWLEAQEHRHRFVLYEAEPGGSAWTRRCIRQADKVLLLADAAGQPEVGWLDERGASDEGSVAAVSRDLVLLHRDERLVAGGTRPWLEAFPCERHHHVRWDRPGDFARLARFVAGKAIGIVFAGGGARGFAHVGVVKALREAGIPIDLAGGTSIGAVIAGAVSIDWDQDVLSQNCKRAFTEGTSLHDFTLLPLVSLIKGDRIEARLRQFLGETRIEDLWLPFFCVSSNLTEVEMTVHTRGMLWKAIRASLSIPGVLPPVVYDGNLHIDGATLDNLPVGLMERLGAGRIIAVDLEIQRNRKLGYDRVPSPWSVLKERAIPGKQRSFVPGIVSTILGATILGSRQKSKQALEAADLCFTPAVKVGLMDWKAFERAVECGYRHAAEKLQKEGANALLD